MDTCANALVHEFNALAQAFYLGLLFAATLDYDVEEGPADFC